MWEIGAVMAAPIRVLIAEGNQAICQALHRLLQQAVELEVVAVTSDAGAALQMAAQCQPMVAVLGTTLPLLDGRAVIPSLYQRFPQLRIVALGLYPTQRDETLASGACRFLLQDAPRADFVAAIQQAAAGECQTGAVPALEEG
jgi:DNA-binding NarL/FixJ family response regulator